MTWNLTGPQGLQGLRGATGAAGAAGPAGPVGPAGPGAVTLHVDSTTPFAERLLGKVGPWTIVASCVNQGGDGFVQVQAVGPKDSVGDGSEVGTGAGVYSVIGSTLELGDDLHATSVDGFNAVNLDLYSPTAGGAHISLFKYDQAAGGPGGFRCKISGTGYQTTS